MRSQLNPHFLFNAINTFRHEMLKGNLAEADKFLLQFSKFLRLILEGSRKDKLSLKDNVDLIENYILLEQSRQNFSFDYTIQLQKNIAVDSIFFPSNILQPIIENAIIHGIFHLQNKKGLLKINFKIAKNLLIATIEDNGIGRAASSLLQIKKHQSHALNIVQETITFLNQKYLSNAIIEVVDKMGEDKSPMGTKFIIQIPFK